MDDRLKKIRNRMIGQAKLGTSDPIYIVQQKQRVFGFEQGYSDDVAWLRDGEEYYDGEESEYDDFVTAKKYYEKYHEEPEGWMRTYYKDIWQFVQPFFARKNAVAYIEANRHNLTDPRIYVESAYRNYEWQGIREVLLDDDSF